jgi:glycosyltransferase involved in cell wall biosynthesis
MKVSVIIPVYNEEETVKNCLESLFKQSCRDLEVIVIDDGSTDKTAEVVSGYADSSSLILLKQKHRGAGAARNLGAKQAKGEIFVFVDGDMIFEKNFIKQLIKPILDGKAIGTFSKEEYLLNKENIWAQCWNINRGLPSNRMHPKDYPDKQKVFRAITKQAFVKAGGFDERAGYTDDWSLSEKLGVEAVVAPKAIFYHRNPGDLKEVFVQSRWMGKRRYKLGLVGILVSLVRVSLPVSTIVGFAKSLLVKKPRFLLFKLISDLGIFIGILEFKLLGKMAK